MRLISIDLLRTLAIALMVLVHFLENLAGSDWAPAGFGAPIFTFLVGVSYRLWVLSQEAKGKADEEITATSVRRGAFLFALGLAFNVLVWLPGDVFNWDVLTLIGSALVLLGFVRNLPPAVPLAVALAALALGPALQTLADYRSFWSEGYFDHDWSVSDVLLGYVATGYFPLCPWLAYPMAGFVTASLFFTGDPEDAPPTVGAAVLGLVLVGASLALRAARAVAPDAPAVAALKGWSMFPPSVEYVCGTLGGTLVAFALLHRWLDHNPRVAEYQTGPSVAKTFSQHSLTMYLLHHVVHLWPLWLYGLAAGTDDVTHYWRRALPAWASVPLAVLCLVVAYRLFRWMDRTGRHGVEGLMRKACG